MKQLNETAEYYHQRLMNVISELLDICDNKKADKN